jgi:hypothetical protein
VSEEHAHYHPGGVPITPQARRFGYEFPVYVSHTVWDAQCSWTEGIHTNTEKRIVELLQFCYDGMLKKLAVQDDFVSYAFKIWYFDRTLPKRTGRKLPKKKRARLGARLFLSEETKPWLYIFNPEEDTLDELTKGTVPADRQFSDEMPSGSGETDRPAVHLHGEDFSTGAPVDEQSDGQA